MDNYTIEDIKTEKEYVSHTCKNCKCAFIDVDELNAQVEAPDYKYCPKCVKLGFKNTKELRENYRSSARVMEYIYKWRQEHDEIPEEDAEFIYNKCLEKVKEYKIYGKKMNTSSIFKQAVEILSYYKEEQTSKNI